MAPPKAVARRLRTAARQVSKLTDPIVAGAAEHAVTEAFAVGGGFRWGRLGARVSKTSNRSGRSSALVEGTPAGAWSIKSYGRRGGYTVRARRGGPVDLRRAGTPNRAAWSARPGAARGDDRWRSLVVESTRDRFRELAVDELGGVTRG